MWAEFGHFALILALVASVIQASLFFIKGVQTAVSLGMRMATIHALLLVISFGSLVAAFLLSDFSVELVAAHSHIDKPTLYKIAGAWGNHEGSLLLWALIQSLYGLVFAYQCRLGAEQRRISLVVIGSIGVATLLFILLASNPFLRLDPAPIVGRGLNPLLQDPGLAIHPPILYAGYVGFIVPYALSIAAVFSQSLDRRWAQSMVTWSLAPIAFLTLGVGLGSWWAYRELGWGGFWFWDPVENASLLPWLSGVALLHSAIILKKTGALVRPTLIFGVVTFALCLFGTFLVRSGLLTSVHAFAVDPTRGLLIFSFFVFVLTVGLWSVLGNTTKGRVEHRWRLLSRAGLMSAGVLMMSVILATILTGTLYPLAVDTLGGAPITVGPPYFNATATPLAWVMLSLMISAPFAGWAGGARLSIRVVKTPITWVVLVGFAATTVIVRATYKAGFLEAALFSLAALGCAFIVFYGIRKSPRTTAGMGMLAAHGGIAIAALGMAGASSFSEEKITSVSMGDTVQIADWSLRFHGVSRVAHANYQADRATVSVQTRAGAAIGTLLPERRWYPAANMVTSEAFIHRTLWSDLYVTLGDLRAPNAREADWALRTYHRPFISWIWAGCLLTFVGGFISLTRYLTWPLGRKAEADKTPPTVLPVEVEV